MTSLNAVRARFARNVGLPFADILTEASIRDVLNEHGVQYRDRVFSPVTTIWGFLSQVLSEDHSCRDAVSRIIAHRAANGHTVCSPNTASYCNARNRIHTSVLSTLARRTAEELHTSGSDEWKWNGHAVFIFDGSSVSMPDTPENQQKYPQPSTQAKGPGFPLARVGVLLSLATGACHDLAIAAYQGKGTGETNLFRRMYDILRSGDVVLADALFDDYFIACELCQRGVHIVAHAQYERTGSWTVENRPDGDLLVWQRPNKPRGMTREQYQSYPQHLVMREVPVDARDKNNRPTQFKVVTTILAQSIDGQQIADLYERRWEGEVDIRSIKSTVQMDILRCMTPDMVHKEMWAHVLAYNLLRTVMAVAAHENDIEPRKVSFKGAKQALTAFAPKFKSVHQRPRHHFLFGGPTEDGSHLPSVPVDDTTDVSAIHKYPPHGLQLLRSEFVSRQIGKQLSHGANDGKQQVPVLSPRHIPLVLLRPAAIGLQNLSHRREFVRRGASGWWLAQWAIRRRYLDADSSDP